MTLRQRAYLLEGIRKRVRKMSERSSFRIGYELGSAERLSEKRSRHMHSDDEQREIMFNFGGKSFAQFHKGYEAAWSMSTPESELLTGGAENRFYNRMVSSRGIDTFYNIRSLRDRKNWKKDY